MTELVRHRRDLDTLLQEHSHACRTVKAEREALRECKRNQTDAVEAQQILQQVAQTIQQEAHKRIAEIVTKCLRSIFEEDAYEFRINFLRKRGRTEARLVFVRDGYEIDPRRAAGGGVVDVAAFALRIACLILSRPPVRRLIVADEPFKHLSAEYRPRIATMIERLAADLKIQVIMVTHSPELAVGKTITIGD